MITQGAKTGGVRDQGPAVIDTFGQSSAVSNAGAASPSDKTVSVLQNFSKYAAAGGALSKYTHSVFPLAWPR